MKRRWGRAWRRRRWWQHLCRFVAWGVLAVAGLYVTIPWWAPTGWIRSTVEQKLSRQAGVEVTIQELSLSWDEVRVEGLAIGPPAGDRPPLAVAEYVRLPLEPLNLLLGRDVAWMEVEGLTLAARFAPDGSSNLAPLARLDLASKPRRVSLRDAAINLHLPDQERLQLNVSDLQFVAGRQRRLGELTLSARLVQPDQPDAPISFRLTHGAGDPGTIAAAIFLFDHVDLALVDLPGLLHLPLSRLNGHMQGRLEFRMNPSAIVDRALVQVDVRQLDAQPVGGPPLEVIDHAGVDLSASWDPLGERIRLRQVALEVPGSIRLDGSARLRTTYPDPWEAIESVRLTGMVNPSRLAALLTGREDLGGGLKMHGPLEWRLTGRHEDRTMRIDELALDAGPVRIVRGEQVLKKGGDPLVMTTAGRLDDRTWRAELSDLRIKWDGLTVDGNAAWTDVRTLPALRQADEPVALASIAMENATCDLRVRADRLDGLTHLGGAVKQLAEAVKLQGQAEARLRINAPNTEDILIDLQADEKTILAVGKVFRKPAGKKLEGRLGTDIRIDAKARSIMLDPWVNLRIGRALVDVRDTALRWPSLTGSGLFRLRNIESYLISPLAADRPMLTGNLSGKVRFANLGDRENRSVELYAALAETGIDAGPWYVKPADEHLLLRAQLDGPTAQAWLTCPAGSLHAWTTASAQPLQGDANLAAGVDVSVTDSRAMTARCPWLQQQLRGWSLQGPIDLAGTVLRAGARTELELSADATGASLVAAGPVRREKPAGVPLRFELAMQDSPRGRQLRTLQFSRLIAALGEARVVSSGTCTYDPDAASRPLQRWPVPGLKSLDANVLIAGQPGGVAPLVPELSKLLDSVSMTEDASLRARVEIDSTGVSIHGNLDGGSGRVALGPIVKPEPLQLRGAFDLACDAELTRWTLADGCAELIDPNAGGEPTILARLLLDARLQGQLRRDGLPALASLRPVAWHGWLASDHARSLAELSPTTAGKITAGSIRLEAENRTGRWGRIDHARLQMEGIRTMHRGREVLVSGELRGSQIGWSPRGGWSVGSLRVRDLEASAGPNHAWLIADLRNLPSRPSGRVRLLADTIDDADLVRWLGLPAPGEPNAVELSDAQVARLRRSARKAIARLRRPMQSLDVDLEADVETLRTTDVSVNQTYEMKRLRADASCRRGQLKANIAAILNGGSYRTSVRANAGDVDQPIAMEFHLLKVVGTEEIQPQLAKYFPGNTVNGLFTRDERLRETPVDSLAYFLDHRYPWTPVGSAKTVATDGYIVGRAVPEWMATVFPQLNLQRYEYRTMTGFADFRESGLAENDMIFSGEQYDVYMHGTTDENNRARYTVGLLISGGSPEWNHAWRAGRMPLLKVSGTIHGGTLLNREVSFLWPNETIMAYAIENNMLYRAYVNQQKEKLRDKP